jgi:CNP1-like family
VNLARCGVVTLFVLAGVGALASLEAAAQELPIRDEAADTIDFGQAPFKEKKVRLPAPPKAENLVRFDAGPSRPGFENFVDSATLTLDEDGVIRYTLVVKSDMGASNVTYEGIRCATRERRVYAYGRRDGTWAEPRDSEWKKIGAPSLEGPVYVLYNDFFCPGRQAVRSAGEAIAALKAGGHPRASDETGDRMIPLAR